MALGTISADMIIHRYREAFLEANGCDVDCIYERGWFRIRHLNSAYGTRHRRKEIEAFIARLRAARKQEAAPSAE